MRVNHWRLGSLLTAALALATGDVSAQQQRRAGVAVFPSIGIGAHGSTGGYPAAPLPILILAGVALEVPLTARLRVSSGVTIGTSPVLGSSDEADRAAEVALTWLVTPVAGSWGVVAGPSVAWYSLGDSPRGYGVSISAGKLRGVGPRLTLRAHSLSGHPGTSVAGLFSVRIGR